MTIEDRNIAVVRRVIQANNDGTIAQIAPEVIAPDFRRHDLADALPNVAGPGGLTDFVQMVRSALAEFHMEIVDIFGCGDRVALRWIGSGIHQGELLGVPPTGNRIAWNAISLYRLVDGKVTDSWQLVDFMGMMRQLGAIDVGDG